MTIERRDDVPPIEKSHLWRQTIDVETNRPYWVPRHLCDEYDRLRFTADGAP